MTTKPKAKQTKVQALIAALPKQYPTENVVGRANTPEKKARILDRLSEAWDRAPHQRLGQLIDNAMHAAGRPTYDGHLFPIEDDDLLDNIEELVRFNGP